MKQVIPIISIIVFNVLLPGCRTEPEGSEQAAKAHFQSEFEAWLAGEESDGKTSFEFATPLSYEVRSISPTTPDPLAKSGELADDWETWPAYTLVAMIEWESEAGTPVEKVTKYRLTWNASEAKWYVAERF